MESLEEFKNVITNNLIYYRKNAKLTQAELAEKINYSDKAVSKWERGETIPDVFVLKELASIYNISVNEFLTDGKDKQKTPFSLKKAFKNKHFLVTCLSTGLVWLIACIVFVTLLLCNFSSIAYLSFIYALPVSAIVCLVFSCIWSKQWAQGVFVTIIIWTTFLSFYLSFNGKNLELIFIIAVPLQILAILWLFLIKENFKIKWHLKKVKNIEENKNK